MALIENIQRENLNPLEEALGLQRTDRRVLDDPSAGGGCRRAIAGQPHRILLRLLQLAAPVQELLIARGNRYGSRAGASSSGRARCRSSWRSG
jgi:ParB family chromosome partitioning protein